MRRTAALIVGGGPAGATAAIALARAGLSATVLERERETADALCGGFLSWRTLAALERMGVAGEALNPVGITRLRLFAGGHEAEAALPGVARAVSRARLDRLLLTRAEQAGAGVERGVRVRGVTGGAAQLADGAELAGDAVLLATGKHDLHGLTRIDRLPADPTLGLRMRLAPRGVAPDTIELHLFDRGYAGLVVQEDGRANICMAVARSRLKAAGDPVALLQALAGENAAFRTRLDAWDGAGAIDAVANVPYGWRAHTTSPRLYRLGDQAAVIPSLAGEGIGIAVASGLAAAQAIERGVAAERYQQSFAHRVALPLAAAGAIRRLAERPPTARLLATLAAMPAGVAIVAALTRVKHPGIDEGR